MSEEMMSTKEVARYLGVHEKQVYALVKAKRIPSTRITGKWVFPKRLIDEWIETHAKQGLEKAREKSAHMGGALLACGSNDPILDMLQTYMKKDVSRIPDPVCEYGKHRRIKGSEQRLHGPGLVSPSRSQERAVQHPLSPHLSP